MKAHLDTRNLPPPPMTHLLDEPFTAMDGTTTTLRELGGQRWLVVNVASACGLTPHYAGLQALHEQHDDLTVVGFPCNQFGGQEPGTHEEICEFTTQRFNVTFPLMAKIDVNGEAQAPLYTRLCAAADESGHSGDIRWNFEKFIVDGEGNVTRFRPQTLPDALPL